MVSRLIAGFIFLAGWLPVSGSLAEFIPTAPLVGANTPTPTPAPLSTPLPPATPTPPCDFSQAVSADVRVVNGRGGSHYTTVVDDVLRSAFADLHGFGLWEDGANGAYGDFTTPDDIEPIAWITVTMADDSTRWVWLNQSPSTPGHVYAFVLTSLSVTGIGKDKIQYLGQHQMCATVDVPLDRVRILFDGPRPEPTATAEATQPIISSQSTLSR